VGHLPFSQESTIVGHLFVAVAVFLLRVREMISKYIFLAFCYLFVYVCAFLCDFSDKSCFRTVLDQCVLKHFCSTEDVERLLSSAEASCHALELHYETKCLDEICALHVLLSKPQLSVSCIFKRLTLL